MSNNNSKANRGRAWASKPTKKLTLAPDTITFGSKSQYPHDIMKNSDCIFRLAYLSKLSTLITEGQESHTSRTSSRVFSHLSRSYTQTMKRMGLKVQIHLDRAIKRASCPHCHEVILPSETIFPHPNVIEDRDEVDPPISNRQMKRRRHQERYSHVQADGSTLVGQTVTLLSSSTHSTSEDVARCAGTTQPQAGEHPLCDKPADTQRLIHVNSLTAPPAPSIIPTLPTTKSTKPLTAAQIRAQRQFEMKRNIKLKRRMKRRMDKQLNTPSSSTINFRVAQCKACLHPRRVYPIPIATPPVCHDEEQ